MNNTKRIIFVIAALLSIPIAAMTAKGLTSFIADHSYMYWKTRQIMEILGLVGGGISPIFFIISLFATEDHETDIQNTFQYFSIVSYFTIPFTVAFGALLAMVATDLGFEGYEQAFALGTGHFLGIVSALITFWAIAKLEFEAQVEKEEEEFNQKMGLPTKVEDRHG